MSVPPGKLEPLPAETERAIRAALTARHLSSKRQSQIFAAGARTADALAAAKSFEWCAFELFVHTALVLHRKPRCRGVIELCQRQIHAVLDHRHETALEHSEEPLLLPVLIRTVGQRRLVQDAQAQQPLRELCRAHRAPVVREQRARETPLLDGLRETVHET